MTTITIKANALRKPIESVEEIFSEHPRTAYAAMVFAMPLCLIAAVGACATAVMLPLSLLAGWI